MPPKASGKAQAAKAVNKKAAAKESERNGAAENDQIEDNQDLENDEEEEEDDENDVEMKDNQDAEAEVEDVQDEGEEDAKAGTKRKAHPTNGSDAPTKQQRQDDENFEAKSKSKAATSKRILNFLMSKDAIPLCFPEDELNAARSGDIKKSYSLTPPNLFTPFEQLVTSILLSKPLSHTLGMRSIRTLLNEPYEFSTPQKMYEAGEDKIWEALEKARTQHRQKTAKQLFDLADSFQDTSKKQDEGDADDSNAMHKLLEEANVGGPQATIEFVKSSVNGLGDVGSQIFCRRVQACDGWGKALWPFADQKSIDSVRECGIDVKDADELEDMIEQDLSWDKVGSMGLDNENQAVRQQDGEVQVAVEFVTLLERAIGCVLEGNVEELKKQATSKA